MQHKSEKWILGWTEYLDFPEWGIRRLKAKTDTGARSSALHVENLEVLPDRRLRFDVVVRGGSKPRLQTVEAPMVRRSRVRSSNGHYTYRYFVRPLVRIGPVEKHIELSLVSREKMLFRMLLGRKALEGDFLVDVSLRSAMGRGFSKTSSQRTP